MIFFSLDFYVFSKFSLMRCFYFHNENTNIFLKLENIL